MTQSKLKLDIRRGKILEQLHEKGQVSVAQLSGDLSATTATIRNDLSALERDGYLVRVQGGAVQSNRMACDLAGRSRRPACTLEKQSIARAVAARIQNGDTLFLNSGTTTLEVAEMLKKHHNLNIVTNSIAIAMELGAVPTFRVLLLGGEVNAQYGFVYGSDAQAQLQRYQADWSVLSVDGVHVKYGFTSYHAEETVISRMMAQQATHTLIAADHAKIGRAGFSQICGFDPSCSLVTDGQCNREVKGELEAHGLEIIIG